MIIFTLLSETKVSELLNNILIEKNPKDVWICEINKWVERASKYDKYAKLFYETLNLRKLKRKKGNI